MDHVGVQGDEVILVPQVLRSRFGQDVIAFHPLVKGVVLLSRDPGFGLDTLAGVKEVDLVSVSPWSTRP